MTRDGKVGQCTGTMITNSIAITAGHCLDERIQDSSVKVWLFY